MGDEAQTRSLPKAVDVEPRSADADPAANRPSIQMPRRIGEYELLSPLGRGGMGLVFKARHLRLKRTVAIKFVRGEVAESSHSVARFLREAEALAQLDHTHVVRAYDAGDYEGKPFLVMEYVDGCSLTQVLRATGPLPVAMACRAIHDAALGLEHVHQHGMLHRDVKPSNLLVTRAGVVKISDLGLARVHFDENTLLTNSGDVIGTADYLAPESLDDTHPVDARADIYGLGCSLFCLLVGRPPFAGGQYSSVLKKMRAHAQEPPPPLRQLRPEVTEGLAVALARALQKNPQHRYATAASFAEALAPYCATGESLSPLVEQTLASDARGDDAVVPTVTFHQSTTADNDVEGKVRRKKLAALFVAAAIVIALVAAWIGTQSNNSPDSTVAAPVTTDSPAASSIGTSVATREAVFEDLAANQIQVGRKYSLLNREPKKVLWPKDEFGERSAMEFLPERHLVNVRPYNSCLLQLGETHSGDFVFEVDVNQPSWGSGIFGVFLGLNTREDGWQTCQVLEFTASRSQRDLLGVTLSEFAFQADGTRLVNSNQMNLSGMLVNPPGLGAAHLEIGVRGGKPYQIRWNGQELPDLLVLHPGVGAHNLATFAGGFGVVAHSTVVDFENAYLRVNRLEPQISDAAE